MTFVSILDTVRGQPPVPQPAKPKVAPVRPEPPLTAVAASRASVAKAPSVTTRPSEPQTAAAARTTVRAATSPSIASKAAKPAAAAVKPAKQASRAVGGAATAVPASPAPRADAGGRKKLSFKDVMRQAQSVDKSKLAVTIRTRKPAPPPPSRRLRSKLDEKQAPQPDKAGERGMRDIRTEKSAWTDAARGSLRDARGSQHDARGGRTRTARAVAARKRPAADLNGFVESDDEADSRYAYRDDYSDSDMDATGGDVLEEESRSAARARREDLEEERRLEELARRKRLRRS